MSFIHGILTNNLYNPLGPLGAASARADHGQLDIGYDLFGKKPGPPPPQINNPNDATQAAQTTSDLMRTRRGLLANIYAGSINTQPVTGKTQLGT